MNKLQKGDYEICIKVKYKTRIFKQYYDLRVTEELHNRSYMSTSFVQQGGMVELAGNAEGGFGKLLYGFFYKGADSENGQPCRITAKRAISAGSRQQWGIMISASR